MLQMRKEEDYRISQTMKLGQLCYKLAGRESKKPCVVVDVVDDNFVIIDGQVKRRRCNVRHLEPTSRILDVKKGDSKDKIISLLEKEGFNINLSKPRQKKERLAKKRKIKKSKPKDDEQRRPTKKVSGNSDSNAAK